MKYLDTERRELDISFFLVMTRTVILIIAIFLFLPGVAQAGDWPMLGHDSAHSGLTDESVEPPLKLLWKFTTGGIVGSSPAVSGGIVYIGSWDKNVYALDATTGTFKWKYTTGGKVQSSPAIFGGVIYVGSGDKNVYALDATTGTLKWKYMTENEVESSLTVSGNVVYVGSGNVYALDAATGALKWNYRTGVQSSPAVFGNVVYAGSYEGNVYALDAATGALKWKYNTTTGYTIQSSPAVFNNVVYVGSNDGNVYAIDAITGSLKRKYAIGKDPLLSIAGAGGVVYVGSSDSNIYTLDIATSAFKWKYTTKSRVYSTPAVSGDTIYVGSYEGNVYALGATTGALKWEYKTGGIVDSSPAVSGGAVYVGSTDGNVYAFASENKSATVATSQSDEFIKKGLVVGETWDLGDGYYIKSEAADAKANPRWVRLSLSRDGRKLEEKVLYMGQIYTYNNIFSTRIDSIYAGTTNDLVILKDSSFTPTNIQATPAPASTPLVTPLSFQPIQSLQQELTNERGITVFGKKLSWSFFAIFMVLIVLMLFSGKYLLKQQRVKKHGLEKKKQEILDMISEVTEKGL